MTSIHRASHWRRRDSTNCNPARFVHSLDDLHHADAKADSLPGLRVTEIVSLLESSLRGHSILSPRTSGSNDIVRY